MELLALEIPEVKLVTSRKFGDERGFFSEVYNKKALAAHGIETEFVQDNHSYSASRGTVRGLHFQAPPYAQAKLVRVVRGSVFDVALDIRRGSPSYGRAVSAVISAEAWNQLLVPVGFAHGFCTLEPGSEVIYKVSAFFAPEHDSGILWNDPDLGIEWPFSEAAVMLSEKDKKQPRLKDIVSPFRYAE